MPFTRAVSRSTWYLLVAIYLSMFAAVGTTMIYTNHVAGESNRRWCGILAVYHNAYAQNPAPPTQLGRDIQTQLETLYTDFDCASAGNPRSEGVQR